MPSGDGRGPTEHQQRREQDERSSSIGGTTRRAKRERVKKKEEEIERTFHVARQKVDKKNILV